MIHRKNIASLLFIFWWGILVVVTQGCSVKFLDESATVSDDGQWRSELYPVNWSAPGPETDFYTDKIIQDFSYAGYRLGAPLPELALDDPLVRVIVVTDAPFNADPNGVEDATQAIQGAIDAAAAIGGGVVYLPEGCYRLSIPDNRGAALWIRDSGIVLRGAGVEKTFLLNTTYSRRHGQIIRVQNEGSLRQDLDPAAAIIRDLPGPTQVLPLASTEHFEIGDWVVVRTDTTPEWVDEHHEPDWRSRAGTGPLNGLAYQRQILAIDRTANTILIDIPTRYAIKMRDNARVHPAAVAVTEVGLEDFSIGNIEHPGEESDQWRGMSFREEGHHGYEVHGSIAVFFRFVRNAWVRNVHTFRPEGNRRGAHILSNGVVMNQSRSLTLENVRMEHPLYGGAGRNGYMFHFDNSSDILARDCFATHSRHGFVFSSMSASGNVILDSEDRVTGRHAATNARTAGSGSDHHMYFSHSNLVDRGRVYDSIFEARYRPSSQHNITAAHSVFWNTLGLGGGEHVVNSDQSRYGYVIGTRDLDGNGHHGVILGDGSRLQTLPIDHLEGVAKGTTLQPQSLYLDQLKRRERAIRLYWMGGEPEAGVDGIMRLSAVAVPGFLVGSEVGGIRTRWELIEGPGEAKIEDREALETYLLLSEPGIYRIRLSVSEDGVDSILEQDFLFDG
jgi:hypothetical protein